MKRFDQRVAVITGGAGTFGEAMAARFAREGMRIVLADIAPEPLEAAAVRLRSAGATVVTVPTDVSNASSVEQLAARALEHFGAVHLVANNAGVATLGTLWESTAADWQWALGVNLMGVAHGVRVFAPILMRQNDEGHIVNTASVAGLISPPGMGIYNVTKHAVVTLTETLHHELALTGTAVRCSVVCPAYFSSGISQSERTRPRDLANPRSPSANQLKLQETLNKAVSSGRITAIDIAELVFAAVRDERFYVLSHPRIKGAIRARFEDILAESLPRDPLGPLAPPPTS